MFQEHRLKNLRFVMVILFILCVPGVHAQEMDMEPDEEFMRKQGCRGWWECYTVCRDNYNDAIDSCEWLDYVGYGTFCRVQASRHFNDCATGCYIQCDSW